jgi:hypothetical protein
MNNTRFYPTLNGECHLGHLVIALMNHHQAKQLGGVFIMRAELRIQYLHHLATMGQIEQWYDSFKRAFDLIGIEAEYMPLCHDGQWIDSKLQEHLQLHNNDVANNLYPIRCENSPAHPYSPSWCLERVLLDNRYAIGNVIRGIDVISEHSLYIHFCKQLQLPVPKLIYSNLITLKQDNTTKVISKTNANGKISSFKDMSKHQLLDLLTTSCLKDVTKGWVIENIKSNPTISL